MKFKYFVHNKMKYINYIFWFVTIEKISLKNQNQSSQSNHTQVINMHKVFFLKLCITVGGFAKVAIFTTKFQSKH